jgi:hypothetical protein
VFPVDFDVGSQLGTEVFEAFLAAAAAFAFDRALGIDEQSFLLDAFLAEADRGDEQGEFLDVREQGQRDAAQQGKQETHKCIAVGTMSVMMSVMKDAPGTIGKPRQTTRETHPEEFTVRDMNRDTAAVLEACRQHGQVVIRHRSGERFAITVLKEAGAAGPEARSPERTRQARERLARHRARMQSMGVRGPATREGIENLNRIIAGEA